MSIHKANNLDSIVTILLHLLYHVSIHRINPSIKLIFDSFQNYVQKAIYSTPKHLIGVQYLFMFYIFKVKLYSKIEKCILR